MTEAEDWEAQPAPDDPSRDLDVDPRARLEAEVARRKAARATRGDKRYRSTQPPAVRQAWKERLARMAADLPSPDPDARTEPVEDPRGEHFTTVFQTEVERADYAALSRWRLDSLAPDQHPELLRGFIDQLDRPGCTLTIFLAGRVGPGKTSAAIAAGFYAAGRGRLVRIVDHSLYLATLEPNGLPRETSRTSYRDRYVKAGLLILDDLGAELVDPRQSPEASKHVRKETLGLVSRRVQAGRPTIITTNQSDLSIRTMLGDRVWSRLQERSRLLEFTHADRRGSLPAFGRGTPAP